MAVGVSLLTDVTATIAVSTTGDTGTIAGTYGSATTLDCDKVTITKSINTADHSGGQSAYELHRATKGTWQVEVEAKYGTGNPSMSTLAIGKQAQFVSTISLGSGLGTTASGILTDVNVDYAGPSTIKFTIKPYGAALS